MGQIKEASDSDDDDKKPTEIKVDRDELKRRLRQKKNELRNNGNVQLNKKKANELNSKFRHIVNLLKDENIKTIDDINDSFIEKIKNLISETEFKLILDNLSKVKTDHNMKQIISILHNSFKT